MKTAFRFSVLVFAPLLIAFLLPALFLLPTGILLTLITISDLTMAISEGVGYNAWVCSPVVAAFGLLLAGIWLHPFYLRGRSGKPVWVAIWVVFSGALFLAAWYGITILTSIGASDYPAIQFLQMTAKAAVFLTLAFQPAVVLWLFVSARILR
jgi:RsiW-degrading membrane proteinase PrsW (M82 family)